MVHNAERGIFLHLPYARCRLRHRAWTRCRYDIHYAIVSRSGSEGRTGAGRYRRGFSALGTKEEDLDKPWRQWEWMQPDIER